MKDIAGFPGFEVEFTKDGQVFDENQVKELLDFLSICNFLGQRSLPV